jgi:hypothetical protein
VTLLANMNMRSEKFGVLLAEPVLYDAVLGERFPRDDAGEQGLHEFVGNPLTGLLECTSL